MDTIFDRMLNSITVGDIMVMFADIQRHTHPILDRIDNYLMPIVESNGNGDERVYYTFRRKDAYGRRTSVWLYTFRRRFASTEWTDLSFGVSYYDKDGNELFPDLDFGDPEIMKELCLPLIGGILLDMDGSEGWERQPNHALLLKEYMADLIRNQNLFV